MKLLIFLNSENWNLIINFVLFYYLFNFNFFVTLKCPLGRDITLWNGALIEEIILRIHETKYDSFSRALVLFIFSLHSSSIDIFKLYILKFSTLKMVTIFKVSILCSDYCHDSFSDYCNGTFYCLKCWYFAR